MSITTMADEAERILLAAGWVKSPDPHPSPMEVQDGQVGVAFSSPSWSGRPIGRDHHPAPWHYRSCGGGEYREFTLRELIGRMLVNPIWIRPEAATHLEVLALASMFGGANVCVTAAQRFAPTCCGRPMQRWNVQPFNWRCTVCLEPSQSPTGREDRLRAAEALGPGVVYDAPVLGHLHATFTPLDGGPPVEIVRKTDALLAAAPKEAVAIEAQNPPPGPESPFPEPLSFNELAFAILAIERDFVSTPRADLEERLRRLAERVRASLEP